MKPSSTNLNLRSNSFLEIPLRVRFIPPNPPGTLGNGDGTLQDPLTSLARVSTRSVFVADLNGNGTPDLAVANTSHDSVSVLLGGSQ